MKDNYLLSTEPFLFCFYLIPSMNYDLSKIGGSKISDLADKNIEFGSHNFQFFVLNL